MKHLFLPLLVFSNIVSAQIPLTREPHHKIVFENGYVRVFDLRIAPGDTTLMHTHSAASVVVFLSTSSLVIRNVDGPAVVTPVKPGDMIYRAYDEKPVAHRVWMEDKAMFRCLVVEIKQRGVRDSCGLVAEPGLAFQWDQKAARAYRVSMPAGPVGPAGQRGQTGPAEQAGQTGQTGPAGPAGQARQTGQTGQRGKKGQQLVLAKSDCAWLTIDTAGHFAFFPPRGQVKVAGAETILLQLK